MGKKYKTAVYIGRFQPIHKAHLKTIETALEKAQQLIIFVGTDNRPPTIKNPFSTDERKSIIRDAIQEYFGEEVGKWEAGPSTSILTRIKIIGCRDYKYNNFNWSSEIYSKALANGASSDKDTLLIGCMKDDTSYYLQMFPQWTFEKVPYMYELDATDIRTEVFENGEVDEYRQYLQKTTIQKVNAKLPSFAEEYEYYKTYKEKHSFKDDKIPYDPIHNTVDALVIKSGCVLLVKRKFHPGINQYALPGGFIDRYESIEDAAIRELKEETRIRVPARILRDKIKDKQIFDHPERSLRGRVITHVSLFNLGHGALPDIKEGSDAKGAEWVPMSDVMKMEDQLFEDHYDIICQMTSKY